MDAMGVKPAVVAPLDRGFVPVALVRRAYRKAVEAGRERVRVCMALEREAGVTVRADMDVLSPSAETLPLTLRLVERHVKFLLWGWGGWRLHVSGPALVTDALRAAYAADGARRFDVELMARVYGKPFVVETKAAGEVPEARGSGLTVGGHMGGCRIGFDLGASDYKVAAVRDGEAVFAEETRWDPVGQADPAYHYGRITEGLRRAAEHLPRVDAIGGSSAGIWVDSEVKVASLFRGVPAERFAAEVSPMFKRIGREWGVPLVVINDGDVTALAGALSLGERGGMLGIAMGSSEAGGYLDPAGHITGGLIELAFAPVDLNPGAQADEWSGDRGVGALFFSQQAVNRLAPAAGMAFAAELAVPERLKAVQARADAGDAAALAIFESMGVYLGYTLPLYREYYDFRHVLVLGRVLSGRGGELIVETARRVLEAEFPEVAATLAVHVPDERSRRVGQAVAAASLPALG